MENPPVSIGGRSGNLVIKQSAVRRHAARSGVAAGSGSSTKHGASVVKTRPDFIVETGTADGGSALYLAMIADMIGHGKVITIDIEHRGPLPPHERVTYLKGSSTDTAGKTLGQNLNVLSTLVKTFFCPSDVALQAKADNIRANLQGVTITLSNYKGVNGSNWCWGTFIVNGPPSTLTIPGVPDCDGLQRGNGMFFRLDFMKKQRLANITDGTSNTFMFGEDIPSISAHCNQCRCPI